MKIKLEKPYLISIDGSTVTTLKVGEHEVDEWVGESAIKNGGAEEVGAPTSEGGEKQESPKKPAPRKAPEKK